MRTFDLTPLFRSSVGFDRLNEMFDSMTDVKETSYPPYNIEKLGESNYLVTMAVAGFGEDDIDITFQENLLIVQGDVQRQELPEEHEYLHKGIASRAFEHKFQLADHIKVAGAELKNGLLKVALEREIPEALKPKKIPIGSKAKKVKTIESKAVKSTKVA